MVYQLAHLFGVAGHQYDVVHSTADESDVSVTERECS
jgi:hypothetical protein